MKINIQIRKYDDYTFENIIGYEIKKKYLFVECVNELHYIPLKHISSIDIIINEHT
jgi:hypothetical protein